MALTPATAAEDGPVIKRSSPSGPSNVLLLGEGNAPPHTHSEITVIEGVAALLLRHDECVSQRS